MPWPVTPETPYLEMGEIQAAILFLACSDYMSSRVHMCHGPPPLHHTWRAVMDDRGHCPH